MTEAADTDTPDEKAGAVKEFIEIVKTVAYALRIALVLRVLLFQPFTIPSASMEPNLYQGDYIIVIASTATAGPRTRSCSARRCSTAASWASAPRRGDIIVFKLPRDPNVDYIKRLIGLPGDKVQVQRRRASTSTARPWNARERASALVDTGYGTIRAGRFEETNLEGRKYATRDYGPDSEAGQHRRLRGVRGPLLLHGRQPRQLAGQPLRPRPRRSRGGRRGRRGGFVPGREPGGQRPS